MSQPEKAWWAYQLFEYRPVWELLFSISLFQKINKSVSHIFDHSLILLLGSVISTDRSECVAKVCFASVSIFFDN